MTTKKYLKIIPGNVISSLLKEIDKKKGIKK
jgi:hypothetical protein